MEELEVRVERLEEDMFQAQVDIGEAEIDIDSLEFSLQETVETVSNLIITDNYRTYFSGMEGVKSIKMSNSTSSHFTKHTHRISDLGNAIMCHNFIYQECTPFLVG